MNNRAAYILLLVAALTYMTYGVWNLYTSYQGGPVSPRPRTVITEAQTAFRAGAIAGVPLFYEPVEEARSENKVSPPIPMPSFELTGVIVFQGDKSSSRAFIKTGATEKILCEGDEISSGLLLTAISHGKATVLFDGKEREVFLAGDRQSAGLIAFANKDRI